MNNATQKRALSVRLPPDLMGAYAGLIEGAGLTLSENIRAHVQSLVERANALSNDGLKVDISFNWRKLGSGDPFPESVGAVMARVTLPATVSDDQLSRMIFAIPEFFVGDHEPYRIDSYYYHRVAGATNFIESSRKRREVLSYSMMEGRWHGGVYRYDDGVSLHDLASEIEEKLRNDITATIRCMQLGLLPEQRFLTDAELAKRLDVWSSVKLPDTADFVAWQRTLSGKPHS
ncbi:hypothetical protein [Stenotrophomonas sp. S39]|uniref:hypothetical protein n=1 Tax=Stenotrophomonas sp. S39 TaxID=2767451 RepID=UPI00190A995C|nr:hypothetical protein [Stenotrophomonas sp. S39]MBK0056971.1 hypothetical protein [Stenotrophomonas sp. S39]